MTDKFEGGTDKFEDVTDKFEGGVNNFEGVTNTFSRNVGNYQSTLRGIPEERRSRVKYCQYQKESRKNDF